jgi:L-2-hydroxyglutarate oxidase LhgO
VQKGFDVAVIGAGIVGLATARALQQRHPDLKVVVIDKEREVARHQTRHNSGVVHAGIYYRPGSLKAKLCREGVARLRAYCEARGLAYDRCGKVIVATSEAELPRLEALYERGVQNGVPDLRRLDAGELRRHEPHAAGIAAIHSPDTAIVDYPEIARSLAREFREHGGTLQLGDGLVAVEGRESVLHLKLQHSRLEAGSLVNCAGLYADEIARRAGAEVRVRIVPFRGEYYLLKEHARHLVRTLIYPVPDPALPFLGVHLTKTVHGEVEAGPNAVFAFAREGYSLTRVVPRELLATLGYRGFWPIAKRYWRVGAYEIYRSLSKRAFVRSLQRLVPVLGEGDIVRAGAGVRAQAVSEAGELVDDFVFSESERALHVLNAPSPAATASLAIAEHIVDAFDKRMGR